MRILAIIPARAGSKGIPNKNIRIIGGHPLVYYAVNNALSSEYITDVIVTTDSNAVRIIASQMGATVHMRSAELCADDVTLDSVIEDAVPKHTKYDYVVTLQPTSPTLMTKTLDSAIKYAISENLDTLISAINRPHLSWIEKDGQKTPNYTKRLNRQLLPPYYLEAGAFVISKACVVTKNSRIGKKVDLFEISEQEAVDVDNFSDLRYVAHFLENQKVAIYVNGNNTRGTGHIYRALELADEFFTKPDLYYDTNQTDVAIFGDTTHKLIPVNGISELFDICKREQYTIFVNDILSTSLDYMIGLRTVLPDAKIINFEDDGEGTTKADIVFNALYHEDMHKNVYAGEKYYLPAKTFMFYGAIPIREHIKKVFISFGGADPQNYTDRLLEIITSEEYVKYEFIVVLGRAKTNVNRLLEYNSYSNIEVLFDVDNMSEIMFSCDIGITSRGRTGYELAILGIPSIAMAQNKREEKHGFVCDENGFKYIGLNPSDEKIKENLDKYLALNLDNRREIQNILLSHDLRGGRKRVMGIIYSY